MKIRALRSMYGVYGMASIGQVIEVNDDLAKQLISSGQASVVEETPEEPVKVDVKEKVQMAPPTGSTVSITDETGKEKKYNTKA